MVIEMDRLNAIRLLQALIAAGKDSSAPMAKAWINEKAWEIVWNATSWLPCSDMPETKAG
jgi:hypothetical protein